MDRPFNLAPIRAHVDRIYDIKCCIRPFRTKGPRLDVEQIGDATVVHNYGHSGAGWSLSWGSADMQVQKAAMSHSPKRIAVIGCGIIGITLGPDGATGRCPGHHLYPRGVPSHPFGARQWESWTPASHMALASQAPANLGDVWERMTRMSWKNLRQFVGMAGNPVAISRITITFPMHRSMRRYRLRRPVRYRFRNITNWATASQTSPPSARS